MVIRARFRIHHRGCMSEQVTGATRVVHMSGDHTHCVATVDGAPAGELERFMKAHPDVMHPDRVIDRGETAVVFRCDCQVSGKAEITPTIHSFGCTVLYPTVYADGLEHFTILGPTRERVAELLKRLEDFGPVTVDSVGEVPADAVNVSVSLANVTSELTAKQLEALRTAIEHGYYASPRAVSAEALAERFGVARSTFQEHLRKAEERIMDRFARVLVAHPALTEGAMRGPGRPPDRRRR